MKRISSGATFFLKRIAPALSLVSMLVIVAFLFRQGRIEEMWWVLLLFVVAAVVSGYVVYRRIWPIADEVFDHGDHLVVRRGAIQEKLRFEDVVHVALKRTQNARRMVLKLARPGPLGDEVVFIPEARFTLNPFASDPLEEDLIGRVDAARRKV